MNEFKFDCPTCGQHILAAHEWIGRKIDCPSCNTSLTIRAPEEPSDKGPKAAAASPKPPLRSPGTKTKPGQSLPASPSPKAAPKLKPDGGAAGLTPAPASPKALKKSSQTLPAAAKPGPKNSSGPIRINSPANQTPAGKISDKDNPKPPQAGSPAEATAATPEPADRPRIAVLSPAIKLDMVRAVRRRIQDESVWLPGMVKEVNAYAAKVSNGKTILVDSKDPEATRFSLLGAFLREIHERNVVRTAPGRTRLLDQEIPDAVRDVLREAMSDEEREQSEDPLKQTNLMAITHAQCLATLELLEELYSQRLAQAQAEKAKRKLGNVRLSDLVKKLEKKAPVQSEDVATALYHELMEVRHRLDKLENRTVREP